MWDAIALYMDDEKREQVHAEMAPCTKKEFLRRYLEIDPDFDDLLVREFNICSVDDLEEYTVIHVGGADDGKTIATTTTETDAIVAAREYEEKHAGDPGYLGVSIYDIDDKEVINWV